MLTHVAKHIINCTRTSDGVFRYGGYLTVTGRNEEDLEQAVAGMRNALSTAAMEAQILYNQQAEALMVNALPIGRGLK